MSHVTVLYIPVHAQVGLPHRPPARPAIGACPTYQAEYVAGVAREMPGKMTLVALGPLTNIASTIALEPMLNRWILQIVVTNHAEFNIYNAHAAARLVLSSGIATTLVGLDVCDKVSLTQTDR